MTSPEIAGSRTVVSDGVPGIVEQAIFGGTALAQGRRVIRLGGGAMLSWKQLEQLERFDSAGTGVLRLSLNLNPPRQATRSYRIAFKSLVKEVSATLTEAERKDLAREVQRVTEWLDQRRPRRSG